MTAVKAMQTVRFQNMQQDQADARDAKDDAIENQQEQINETYKERMKKVEEDAQAAKDERNGTLFGTIFGGILVGTLIGQAFGKLAAKDNKSASRDAEQAAGFADLERSQAKDSYNDALEDFENVQSEQEQVEKFGRELRQADFQNSTL